MKTDEKIDRMIILVTIKVIWISFDVFNLEYRSWFNSNIKRFAIIYITMRNNSEKISATVDNSTWLVVCNDMASKYCF